MNTILIVEDNGEGHNIGEITDNALDALHLFLVYFAVLILKYAPVGLIILKPIDFTRRWPFLARLKKGQICKHAVLSYLPIRTTPGVSRFISSSIA